LFASQIGFKECTCCWSWQGWRRFRRKKSFAFCMWLWRGM